MENGRSDSDVSQPRQKDLDDLQNEIAGRETGRRKRFLVGGERSPEGERRKREAEQALRTKLELMLANPAYRAKYDSVMDDLRKAEQATEAALDHIRQMMRQTDQTILDMEDRAARLPDGSLVFRDANGVVRRADGSVVEDHLAETILWTGNEPRYEDYHAQRDRLDALSKDQREVTHYRDDVLGSARDRLTDPDNPAGLDQLDDIHNGFMASMPKIIQEKLPEPQATAAPHVETTQVSMPSLSGDP